MRTRTLLPLLLTALLAALTLAALRIDLLRIRYALAESIENEQRLLDEQRSLTARMRQLRDPVGLTRRAGELGFVRPDEIIDLPRRAPAPKVAEPTRFADAGTAALDRR